MKKQADKNKNVKDILDALDLKIEAERNKTKLIPKTPKKKVTAQMLFKEFPIGKFKNQPIENVLKDKQYCQWLCNTSWFEDRYPPLFHAIEEHLKLYFLPESDYPLYQIKHNELKTEFFICPN